jgi:hypothetical protein
LALVELASGEAAADEPSSSPKGADEPAPALVTAPNDPLAIAGLERPASPRGYGGRALANAILVGPRLLIDYTFKGVEVAANLVTDRQLVSRYRELFGSSRGDLYVFPTLFAETGTPASVGVRMIFDSPRFVSSQRVGFGGPRQVESETRVVLKGALADHPSVLSLEAHYQLEDDLEYYGIGVVPRSDPRNRFVSGTPFDYGYYTERRVRFLASGGVRLGDNLELLVSTSLYRRQTEPAVPDEPASVATVFEPGSISGLTTASPFVSYSEVAARIDTRRMRNRPSPGWLFESYVGGARSLPGASTVAYMRLGLRAGVGIPVRRRTNVFALRLSIDGVTPLSGTELPFVEFEHPSEFRGFDTRRDQVAILGSADYAWQLVPVLGMRLFVDAVTVAPSLRAVGVEQFQNLRLAAGFGFDVFSGSNTLASLATSASGDGVRVVATFGAPVSHGDRQHRR